MKKWPYDGATPNSGQLLGSFLKGSRKSGSTGPSATGDQREGGRRRNQNAKAGYSQRVLVLGQFQAEADQGKGVAEHGNDLAVSLGLAVQTVQLVP